MAGGALPRPGDTTVGGPAASLLVVLGLVLQNLGAAYAKALFPAVGALGATALRVALAALILAALTRPWRGLRRGVRWPAVLPYGLVLGLMNILIYQAFARIPIGLAVAIELIGPLAVVIIGSRKVQDLLFAGLAMAGLALLLPLKGAAGLDLLGVGFALGAAASWALYILLGSRAAGAGSGPQTVALGLAAATLVTAPLGLWSAGAALFRPEALAAGLALAVLSSAAPYTLEMMALRRLPPRAFGLLVCAAPAVATVIGWLVLGERLSPLHALAVALITIACVGGAARARTVDVGAG